MLAGVRECCLLHARASLEAAVSLEKQRELVLWASLFWLIGAVWSLIGPASCTLMIRVSGLCALCFTNKVLEEEGPTQVR